MKVVHKGMAHEDLPGKVILNFCDRTVKGKFTLRWPNVTCKRCLKKAGRL